MKIVYLFSLLAVLSLPSFAIDYAVDTTFNHPFATNDAVYDAHLLGDGKILVAGGLCQSFMANCTPFLFRLNTDGTRDMAYTVLLNRPGTADGFVRSIEPLTGGKFLIVGDFNIGTTRSQYARINADGSIDPTLPPVFVSSNFAGRDFAIQPDGKMVFCTERTINGELYRLAHRINADGTPDPTFRVNFMPGGFCTSVEALPSGKVLMSVNTFSFEPDEQPLRRLNSDGSLDATFQSPLPIGSYVTSLKVLPDSRILVSWGDSGSPRPTKRLSPDGDVELDIPLCSGAYNFVPLADGSMIVSGCKRWEFYYGNRLQFAKVYADGSVDQRIDNIRFDENSSGGVSGIIDAGGDRFYVYGGFGAVQGDFTKKKFVRLAPNNTPKPAKFDFDGDGKSDITVYRPSNGYWYLYQSTEGIKYFPWGFSTDTVAAAHFDNDGKTDFGVFRDGTWHGWSSLLSSWRPIQLGTAADKPMPADLDELGPTIQDQLVRGVRGGVAKWFIREGQYVIHQGPWQPQEYTLAGELPADKPVTGDFNGDSRDEFGYFQNGRWYTVDYFSYAPPKEFQWGLAGDIPVPGDYDGDRQDDYAIYRPSTGTWWVKRSSGGMFALQFGISTDIPVPADYDGDGKMDLAIYRDGQWWQYLSATGTYQVQTWGNATDKPVQAQSQ